MRKNIIIDQQNGYTVPPSTDTALFRLEITKRDGSEFEEAEALDFLETCKVMVEHEVATKAKK